MTGENMEFRCTCGKEIATEKKMIEHYKAEHPDNPWGLWDQIGTIGDPWADKAMAVYRDKLAHYMKKCDEHYAKAKECDAAVARYNRMARCFNLISGAIDLAASDTV
jgi:hypothetical protein